MNYFKAIALAMTLATSVAMAETVEKTITRSSTDGVTTEKTTTYESRTEAAYKSIGLPTETIVKLKDYDSRIYDARVKGDTTLVKRYYDQQVALLKPEQVTQIRTYLTAHPITTGDRVVTYWEEVAPVTTSASTVVTKEVQAAPATVTTTREVPVVTREVRVQPSEVKVSVPSTTVQTEEVTVQKSTN